MAKETAAIDYDTKHYKLRISIFGAFARAFLSVFIISLFGFLLFFAFGGYFALFLIVLFLLIFGYYAIFRVRARSFPMQTCGAYVATPERKMLIVGKGQTEIEKKFKLEEVVPFMVNLKGYIHNKSNRNVLITGSSGQGKSKLTHHLLNEMTYQKLIFSFKPGEEYLRMGYQIRDISKTLPNPFANPEAFVNAFVVAFPLGSIGIQASLVPTTIEKLVKKSANWQDFGKAIERELKSTKETNIRSAVSFIKAHSARLAYDVGGFSIGSETVVLDFSALNEDAKGFYAELVLRQVYSDMEQRKRKDVLICVDEAHRLTTGDFGRYHTIIVEMSREIRDKGMLWITTQNYADIPDSIRNQFASQFLFKTTSQADLSALRSIEPLLAWTVSSLPKHHFVDAQAPEIHTAIPAYYYNPRGEVDKNAEISLGAAIAPSLGKPQASKLEFFKPPEDRPTATQHAAMLALYNNQGAALSELTKYLKRRGWITGDPTIYGSKGRIGIFESLVKLGLSESTGKSYKLTEKGLKWVDPSRIIEDANNLGSDLHMQLIKKTIEKLHDENMLVVAPKGSDAPDLIAYPVANAAKKKYMWDDKNRKAYEIQTTAREDSIMANAEKKAKYNISITWVTYDESICEDIKELTKDKDGYLLIKV